MDVKKILKKEISIILSILMLVTILSTNANAITVNEVNSKLISLMNQYVGTYWTTDGKPSNSSGSTSKYYYGIQCKGFAGFIFNEIFQGGYIGKYDSNKYYIPNPNNARELGKYYGDSVNVTNISNLFSNGMPGDFIQVRRRGKTYGHSMILVNKDSGGITVFDCNSDGKCGVKKYYISYSTFVEKNIGVSLYRATNYEDVKPFRMDVDTPNNSIIDCDEYAINGWAIDESGVNRVTCSINDGAEFDAERYERTDVSNAFPGYPTGREGFTARLPIRSMKNGDNKVVIRVYCGNGVVKDWGMNVKFNDSESPVILDTRITECSDEEFVFSCWFNDNFAVSNVRIAVWSDEKGGQDDLIWYDGNIEGNKTSIRVNIKDHNYEYGPYWIHAYVYDVGGNYSVGTGPLNGLYLDKSPVEVVNKNGNIYAVFRKPLKWHEAKEICEQMGGHLMTITESWEQNIAKDFSNKYGNLYIGATDEEEEGDWKWVTGENFDYTQWAMGQPDNAGSCENYLGLFQNGLWNDFSNNYFGYILEIDSDLPILGKRVFGNKEYLCYDYSMAWEVAEEYCKNKGGNLAIIDSKEKNDVISNLIKDGTKDGYFLGASDKDDEGNWKWINGASLDYTNWLEGEPNNAKKSEDYLEIYKENAKWNDLASMGWSDIGFICERTINSIDITPPSKTTYNVGESLDLSRIKVVANYDNGISEEIEDYNISGYTSTAGEKTITVSYGEKTATFKVIVKANPIVISSFKADKVSPQVSGIKITLKAEASGDELQYKFLLKDAQGNWYKLRDYTSENSYIWTTGTVGNKILYVDIKDSNGQVVRKEMQYKVISEPPIIDSFIVNKLSPQASGTVVTLTAQASGIGKLQYKFLVRDAQGNWYVIRNYSTSNTVAWTTGLAGNKTLYVDVKDEQGQVTRKSIPYTVLYKTKDGVFSYSINNGKINIYKCLDKNKESIVIPSEINGVKVTKINSEAFFECGNVKTIKIPETIEEIGDYAFRVCSSLENIVIPKTVTSVGKGIFRGCENLKSVEILGKINEIPNETFRSCSSLSSIMMPSSIKTIGNEAFYGCFNLPSITIPSSVSNIGNNAFGFCRSLENITIPESVKNIDVSAFQYCSKLINVKILSELETIKSGTFAGCVNLKSINIPNSVKMMGNNAFYNCDNIVIYYYENSYLEQYSKENNIRISKVAKPIIESFKADKVSPQPSNTKITLKAEASGAGTLQYKFLIRDDKGNWYVIRNYSSLNTCTWTTGAIGNKTLYVDVKDSNGQVIRKSMTYVIK